MPFKRSRIIHLRGNLLARLLFICLCFSLSPITSGQQKFFPNNQQSAGMFEEISQEAGINFKHAPPVFDQEIRHVNALWANFIAAGAIGDFNNDGLDDIFLVSSRAGVENALYQNRGSLRFEDVAQRAGVANLNDEKNVGSGALWFDYNNDGWLDLLVLRLGHNLLFKNNGNETFTDVTTLSGLGRKHQNAISAIAFDYDRDGDLDLLVGGFFADEIDLFNLTTTRFLPKHGHRADNGGTKTLYRNNGDGTFTDASRKAGIKDSGFTTALGHGDYDSDGWQDFYIANDFGSDRLYHNNRNGTFTDVTLEAMGLDGRKGMNAEFGDYNNDGKLDIYVTNITEPWFRECNMLWLNWGDGVFVDVSQETGTCDTGWGWGAKFLDFDNDGLLDLYVANGFISAGKEDYAVDVERWQQPLRKGLTMDFIDANIWPPIGHKSFAGYERNRLFHNQGGHVFREMGQEAGVDSLLDGRGVALADFDNDGAVDIFVTNSDQPPLLYRNRIGRKNNWLEIKLTGVKSNRSAVGARVKVVSGALAQIREVNCGDGYQAQSSFQLHFGLGRRTKVDLIEIKWPSGSIQRLKNISPNRLLAITEKVGK
jgi:hypothetical protein